MDSRTSQADSLGSLLDVIIGASPVDGQLRDLLASCAGLAAGMAAMASQRAGFVDDGFTLSCRELLASCLDAGHGDARGSDAGAMLAVLSALAANVGDLEVSRSRIAELAGGLPPDDVARARARLLRMDSQQFAITDEKKQQVLSLFGTHESMPIAPLAPDVPAAPSVPSSSVKISAPAPPAAPSLRDLVSHAPRELRCALDGKLLCDPVRTPQGIVFERASLLRWMQLRGGVCPLSGAPLSIDDCERCAEIRRQVIDFVRGEGRPKRRGIS